MEEKKVLKLKLKTFADLRRFTSKQLHKIVERLREKNKNISLNQLESEEKYFEIMKYAARQSLLKRADRNRQKQEEKIQEDYKTKKEKLMEAKENGEISEEKYERAVKQLKYKMEKKEYVKDLGPEDQEKPKNPAIQRAIKNVVKGLKIAGSIAGSIVALPFVAIYKGATAIGKGVKAIAKGGQVATLTAAKVAGNVKEQVKTAKGEVHREMYEKASEKKKQEMMENAYEEAEKENRKRERKELFKESIEQIKDFKTKSSQMDKTDDISEKKEIYDSMNSEQKNAKMMADWNMALKENKKREREAARREKLHMNAKPQSIDHEKAMKKTTDNKAEQQLSQEEK